MDSPLPSCSLGTEYGTKEQRSPCKKKNVRGKLPDPQKDAPPQHIAFFWKFIKWYSPGTVPFWELCGKVGIQPGSTLYTELGRDQRSSLKA